MSRPKLLYISAHETLEWQECDLFNRLGFDVFPIGHYTDQDNPIKTTLGTLPFRISEEWLPIFKRYHDYEKMKINILSMECGGRNPYMFRVKKEFADLFDIIVVCYYEENITLNWNSFAGKNIVLRTISQYPLHVTPYRDKIKIVSLAENEECLLQRKPDAVIRQCVDTNFYSGWAPNTNYLLTVNKWIKNRGPVSEYDVYDYVSQHFNRVLCGFKNDDIPWAKPELTQEEIQELRRRSRVYLSMCSKPGCVTYSFIEALATGIPVVSVGPELGSFHKTLRTFNVDRFIQNGVNGFYSDKPPELIAYIKELMTNTSLAKQIGQAGRRTAIEYFSKEKCLKDWQSFFKENM